MKLTFKKSILFSLIFFIGIILSACSGNKREFTTSGIKVGTTTNFYGNVARAVLGKRGQVVSIINSPDIDPHDFEPTIKTAKTVADSDIFLYNGVGYDTWVDNISGKNKIAVGEDIAKVHDGENEHVWYKPAVMKKTALYLAAEYSQIQPQHKRYFYDNARRYNKQINQLIQMEKQIRKHSKNQAVAVSEPVFDYSLEDMGYKISNQHFAQSIDEGTDPTYTDIKQLSSSIAQRKIAFFVYNTQSDGQIIDQMVQLCHKHHVPVVKVTETMPQGDNYISWMKEEYSQIQDIQAKEGN